ncbi:hypothetical protein [Segnochrobactrum spirostomi]|uniref:Uncharacterized protein n=1 Tax=Segnochrobactrum spirostomi TaxID=2608987 RepID=A0A6A7Y3K6_9HYPH|nr:hypothetical protein [Segnochrobactrum spirostomi]MQT12681.1 hypothetical protein [Segnochrobactrum spirostomi]
MNTTFANTARTTALDDHALAMIAGGTVTPQQVINQVIAGLPFGGEANRFGPCPNPDAFPIGPCPNPDAFPVPAPNPDANG